MTILKWTEISCCRDVVSFAKLIQKFPNAEITMTRSNIWFGAIIIEPTDGIYEFIAKLSEYHFIRSIGSREGEWNVVYELICFPRDKDIREMMSEMKFK